MFNMKAALLPLLFFILLTISCRSDDPKEPETEQRKTAVSQKKTAETGKKDATDEASGDRPRVLIIGFDGVDPKLLDKWMDEGLLPNTKKLTEKGYYSPLGTTTPPQSPVAWATFASGHNPGEHGIYDFIRRNPDNYFPQVATVKIDRPVVKDGKIISDLKGENLRRGDSFWQKAGRAGVRGSVLFVPYCYPPDGAGDMRVISGLGTPDIRGTNATFHFFGTEHFPDDGVPGPVSGGVFVKAESADDKTNIFDAYVTGPTVNRDGTRDPVSIAVRFAVEQERVEASHQGRKTMTARGKWSDPMIFDFGITENKNYQAFSRYFPLENNKDPLAVYLGTLSADPRNPPFKLSFPEDFASEMAEAIGRPYKTVGWTHEMNGLSAEALDEAGFLSDMYDTMQVREDILMHVLESGRDELTVAVFTATDRVAHMFWRLFDEKHPLYDQKLAALYGNAIRDTYVRMDEIIGRILEVIDDNTLLFIMSDHGFHGFSRGVNINRWLVDNGYMYLRNNAVTGGDFFRDVDWSRTRAYSMGTGQLSINMAGRERNGIVSPAEATALAEEIALKINGLMDNGTRAIENVHARQNIYSGQSIDYAPDLVISFAPGYRTGWKSILGAAPAELFEDNMRKWSGDHAANCAEQTPGILISNRKLELENPDIKDFASTILSIYGIDHELPGKVWKTE